jgi:cytochrome c peroxidase
MARRLGILIAVFGMFAMLSMLPEPPVRWPEKTYVLSAVQQDSMCVELGRALFYDPILSRDSTISCASCHSSYVAFTHVDHKVSHGIDDRIGRRNAPALMNLAWSKTYMWDGAINHLDMQPLAPITNALEMDEQLPHVLEKLQASRMYRRLFDEVFGDSLVTTERMLKSLSAFLITLESNRSKYDAVQRGEALFSEQEQRGYQLFKQHCNACHTEPLFTNGGFRSNGIALRGDDFGRGEITGIASDSGLFKVPTLRNVYYSRPYMHDGRMARLSDVMLHYSLASFEAVASAEMKMMKPLNEEQRIDLTSFLLTLSDSSFVFEKKHQYPFKLYESYSVQH